MMHIFVPLDFIFQDSYSQFSTNGDSVDRTNGSTT